MITPEDEIFKAPKQETFTLGEWLDGQNHSVAGHPVIYFNPSYGPYVHTIHIVRTAAPSKDFSYLYAIIGDGPVQYKTLDQMHADFKDDMTIALAYLPGREPVQHKRYGVYKFDFRHPMGGHWYTNEAHTWLEACGLAANYGYQDSYARNDDWRHNVDYKPGLLPEAEWTD